jgi:hypothetical protein
VNVTVTVHEGVVGAEGDGDAGPEEGVQREGGELEDAEGRVGGGADLERHAAARQEGHGRRVGGGCQAVPDALRAKGFHAVADVPGTVVEAGVRGGEQAGLGRDAEGRCEVGDDAEPLVVGQPEPDDPLAGVPGGHPGQRGGVRTGAGPARRHDHPGRRAGDRGQNGLHHRLDATEQGRVRGGVDLDLHPAAPVGEVVLERLGHHPTDVPDRAHRCPGGVVTLLERGPSVRPGRQCRRH